MTTKQRQQFRELFADLSAEVVEAVIELAWHEKAQSQSRWRGAVSPDVRIAAARTYTGRLPATSLEGYIASLPRPVQQGLLAIMLFGRERGRYSAKCLAAVKQSVSSKSNIAEYLASKSRLGEYLERATTMLEL